MSKKKVKTEDGRRIELIADAKKRAKEDGIAYFIEELGVMVHPDGTEVDNVAGPDDVPPGLEPGEGDGVVVSRTNEDGTVGGPPITATEINQRLAEPSPGVQEAQDALVAPIVDSVIGLLVKTYTDKGLTEDQAKLLVQTDMEKELNLPQSQGAAPSPRTPGEVTGPDPRLVAEYHARMKDYVEPKLTEEHTCTLKVMFGAWVQQWATWQGVMRGRVVEPKEALALMVAEHWQLHAQERALLTPSATGPAQEFNPTTGSYG